MSLQTSAEPANAGGRPSLERSFMTDQEQYTPSQGNIMQYASDCSAYSKLALLCV